MTDRPPPDALSPLPKAVADLLPFALPVLAVLADDPTAPMVEVLAFERAIRDEHDATTRLVYADWLRERGCALREWQVRYEVQQIAARSEGASVWRISSGETRVEPWTNDTLRLAFVRKSVGTIGLRGSE